ncbi:MAG: hypothetical protein HF978_08800 [Desulfobacteraceae bacterium]|nr:hypothetical protein [Desulfobacteraceae bacterium]MBC2755631.1 hypothetical protein [Desulfobacteraceae bacterium]
MTTKFEIIKNHIKKGSFADCFGKPNIRFLSTADLKKDVWMIQGAKGILAYHDLTKQIYNKFEQIKNNYTIRDVEKVLDSLIHDSLGQEKVSENEIVNKAKRQLSPKGIESFDILRNIYGIVLSKKYRKIGPFTFQKGENAYKHYFRGERPWKGYDIKKNISSYVVRCHVKSATQDRALEIADETFTTLEYLFAFILGNKHTGYEVRILRQTKENRLFHLSKSESGNILGGNSRENSVHNEIDLNDPFFKKKKIRKLFSIVPARGLTQIESRLNKAVIWIGKGLASYSSIESIISYCSALEALLLRDPNAPIFTPSNVASLSECCAFFLGKKYSSRKEIAKKVNLIYKERSAGTHGGKVFADPQLESTALEISRHMVFRLLELYPQRIETEKDLFEFVDRIKFS